MEDTAEKESLPLRQIILIGDSDVGKTALINRLISDDFHFTYETTVGVDSRSTIFEVNEGENTEIIRIDIWDTMGNERSAQLSKQYSRKAQGIMLVYSVTWSQSLNSIEKWYNYLKENIQENIPIVLVGNKKEHKDKIIKYEEGKAIAEKYNWNFFEVSALSGEGVKEAFTDIITKAHIYYKCHPIAPKIKKQKKKQTKKFFALFQKKENITESKPKEEEMGEIIESEKIEHKKEILPDDFKDMITKIDKERDLNQLYIKLVEIENILQEMKPVLSENNIFQNTIITLFRKTTLIRRKVDRDYLYLKLFLQFLIVFPNYRQYLNEKYNLNYEIINTITSIENQEEKLNFYTIYTNNFTDFTWLEDTHLIELYNFFFIIHSSKIEAVLNELSTILLTLCERIDHVKPNENKKRNKLFKINEIIQTFGDILIFFLIKTTETKQISLINTIIGIIPKLFPLIFSISIKHHTFDNALLFKILCIYCLFYSNSEYLTYQITNHIIDMFKNNSKLFIPLLFDIYYTMNLQNKNYIA